MEDIDGILACVDAGEVIAVEVATLAKDGIQFSDGLTLLTHLTGNPVTQAKLFAAYSKAKEVKGELADLDNKEKRQLTHRAVDLGYNIADVFIGS